MLAVDSPPAPEAMGMTRILPKSASTVPKQSWDSPAYDALNRHNLMRDDWRVNSYDELQVKMGNSTPIAQSIWG